MLIKDESPRDIDVSHEHHAGRDTRTLLSAIVPGAGQLAQGRIITGVVQFGTVAMYVGTMVATHSHRALWLALAWNVWSAVEAYWHDDA